MPLPDHPMNKRIDRHNEEARELGDVIGWAAAVAGSSRVSYIAKTFAGGFEDLDLAFTYKEGHALIFRERQLAINVIWMMPLDLFRYARVVAVRDPGSGPASFGFPTSFGF